jgi:hypothetical protein
MSSVSPEVTLSILCFPDITGATIKIWGTVAFGSGYTYTTGGIPFGLLALADSKTVNFDGFLRCDVFDEAVSGATVYTFRYIAPTDSLQIFANGAELANGASIPSALVTDSSILFEATFNRTEMLG